MTTNCDVAILGAGSAGYAAALRAAQLGLGVVLVDADEVGGTCLHRGCIPTKSWLHAAEVRRTLLAAPALGIGLPGATPDTTVDAGRIRERTNEVIDTLHKGLEGLLRSRRIEVVRGSGRLVVDDRGPAIDMDGSVIRARHVVLATGARPVTIGLPVDGERVLTSEHALQLDRLPTSAVIIGGGVIGVEFASMWTDLGVDVTLVEAEERLLGTDEPDFAAVLARSLRNRGADVRLGAAVGGVEVGDSGVRVDVGGATVEAEVVLVAVGRRPDTTSFEGAGVRLTEGAHVAVDDFLMSSVRGVYAVGDLVAGPQLAHRGYAHGMFVAERIAVLEGRYHGRPELPRDQDIARITYSSPQLASVGLTADEAARTGEIEVASYPLRSNGRALTLRAPGERETGIVRIIRRKDGEVVGVHMLGEGVAELIGEGALLVNWQATPDDMRHVVHPHPTLSEALGEAALQLAGVPLHVHG